MAGEVTTESQPKPALEPGFVAGVRAVIPLAAAVGLFGVSYGVLARSTGFGVVAPLVMSATTFAGSAQFAVVSVLGDGGGLGAAIVAAILLNARYGPIGLSVAPALKGPLPRRFAESQLVVDESWAIGHLGEGQFDRGRLMGAGIALYIAWLLGTAIGVVGGDLFGEPEELGMDAAFPALFLSLLVQQLRGPRHVVAALLGGGIALLLVPITDPGIPIVAATAGAAAAWRGR